MNSGTAPEDETIVQSVDAILNSNVCMGTVSESVESNTAFTEKLQEATEKINEETKTEIQNKIESSLEDYRNSENYDEAKEKQYSDLASLFGITLTGGVPSLPDGINPDDIPGGFNPEDYLG